MKSFKERFNESPLTSRATLVSSYSRYIDYYIEPGYYYHLYELNGDFIMVVYEIQSEMIYDIWMMDYWEIAEFANRVNISELWK